MANQPTIQPSVRIELLGGFRVRCGEQLITRLKTRKTAALLAYLALFSDRAHPREVLAEMLWPDEEPMATRDRLRQALSTLRRALELEGISPESLLVADRSDVRLEPRAFTSDVADFERALVKVAVAANAGQRFKTLTGAIDLYSGELLPGFYEEFVAPERGRLANSFRDALGEAAIAAADMGDTAASIVYARRAIVADPLREDAHCSLIGIYAAAGRVSDGVRQFHELERVLREELGLSPSAATRAMVAELRAGGDSPRLSGPADSCHPGVQDTTQQGLEPEGGAVPLESAFYIRRTADGEFDAAVARRDSIVLVKGARQIGKTSLLARGLQSARTAGAHIAFTDLQKLTSRQLESADTLFLTLAESIADQLGLDFSSHALWNADRGWNVNFERFVRRGVLDRIDGHVVWAIDEVDRLFGYTFCAETLGLFRSWHNERALSPDAPWSRLTLAMAYSTEAHLFITDLNQSPFNVGTRLTLEDLALREVTELNRRYRSPLRDPKEVARYYALVGGQPYLVRRGLHIMAAEGMEFDAFEAQSCQENGAYGDHLRRMYGALREDAVLCEAVRAVMSGQQCPAQESFYRLRSAGVLAGPSPEKAALRCGLYQTFLASHLS